MSTKERCKADLKVFQEQKKGLLRHGQLVICKIRLAKSQDRSVDWVDPEHHTWSRYLIGLGALQLENIMAEKKALWKIIRYIKAQIND